MRWIFACLLIVVVAKLESVECHDHGQSDSTITLSPLGTLYLPFEYIGGVPQYQLNKGVAEQCSYDKIHKTVYVAGESGYIYIIDISNPANPALAYNVTVPMIPTDVEVCGNHVAISMKSDVTAENGRVHVYETFNQGVGSFSVKHEIPVGALPDMVAWTTDCKTLLVANEGVGGKDANGQFADPEGSVTIVKFNDTQLTGTVSHTADFRSFDDRAEEYVSRGVRWIFRNRSSVATTLSQDLEPEYITINKDDTKAYVVLQENNAMAVLDLVSMNLTSLHPLGFKRWNESGFDASDKDNEINIRPWNVLGMYQPDSIKYFEVGGVGYVATANEGDAKEYKMADHGFDFEEETTIGKIATALASSVDNETVHAASNDAELGRLRISSVDGKGPDDKYNVLYAYGGRSFSIFKADDMSLVYDSGSEVEYAHARKWNRSVFNSHIGDPNERPIDSFDTRSDNKGPECESLTITQTHGKTVFFIGNERTSSIIIFSIDDAAGLTPRYESIYRAGGLNATYQELYDARNVGDIDPEALSFIPGSESPNNKPILLVSGSVSGTLAIYEVRGLPLVSPTPTSGEGSTNGPISEGSRTDILPSILTLFMASLAKMIKQM